MSQRSVSLNWQERWLITSTLIVVVIAGLLVASAVGAGVAIQRGAIVGPEMDLRLGDVRVMAVTSEYPDCNPRLQACQASIPLPNGEQPRYYTIWVVTHRTAAGPDGATDQSVSARLVRLQAPSVPK